MLSVLEIKNRINELNKAIESLYHECSRLEQEGRYDEAEYIDDFIADLEERREALESQLFNMGYK